jgi:phosphohistidine phosphatase
VDLILWRHADAAEGGRDLERKLTAKGRKQAARVAEWLVARLPSRYSVLASPAHRARETADALGVRYKVVERLAPGAAPGDILEAAGWPSHKGAVIVVGHQPDLGRTAALLLTGAAAEWSVKKGGLWWLSNRERAGEAQVVVRAVLAPEFL